jgi:hypothetical protein
VNTIDLPPAPDTHPTYDPAKHTEQCYVCGRGLTETGANNGWWVHMSNNAVILPIDLDDPDAVNSQGWFPVGSECARQIPSTHKTKINN